MHHLRALLLLAAAVRAQALTYWVSDECAAKGFDEAVMNEVRLMGAEASARVKDDGDENMGYSFKQVFKVERSDESVKTKALKAFDTIAGLTKTDDMPASDVRIYCDNDDAGKEGSRWVREPGKKNKAKPFKDQIYWDKQNQIYRRTGSKGCQELDDDGEMFTLAQTYKLKGNPDKLADTHNPDRETITICDQGLDFDGVEKLLADFPEDDKAIVTIDFGYFDALLSITVFHEFCHLTKVIDAPGTRPGDKAELGGWKEVVAATPEESIDSADAFAWLGMLALMEKRNMRLARPDSKDEEEKKKAEQENGGIVFIDPSKGPQSSAKRSLRTSGAYFNPLANLKVNGKRVVKFHG